MRAVVLSRSPGDAVAVELKAVLKALPGVECVRTAPFDDTERRAGDADLLAVCLAGDVERGLEVIRDARANTTAKVLAAGPVVDPRCILRALESGADHYLDQDELAPGVEAWLARLQSQRDSGAPLGRLRAILSASGGCGASTLAVNLGALAAQEHGRCNLIDLNFGRGDLAALLNLRPQFTLADIFLNEGRLDRSMYEKMLVRHSSGIHLLASPCKFDAVRSVTARGVGQALDIARRLFPEVVVDLEDCFHEDQALVLRQATGTLLVCRLDFTSLRNARRVLGYLDELGVPRYRVKLVVNQSGQLKELPRDEAEHALGQKFAGAIRYDPKAINGANNTGMPAVLRDPSSKVAEAIRQLSKVEFDKPQGETAAAPALAR